MKWVDISGKSYLLPERKYKIVWDGPSASNFQKAVKLFLKKYWWQDVVGEEVRLPKTRLKVDLVNFSRRVAIEVNGGHHQQHSPYFQKYERDFEEQVIRDVLKEHLLEKNGFQVIEIYERNMPLTSRWITQTFGEGILD